MPQSNSENYKMNLKFWDTAWARVTKPIYTPPDLNYVKEIVPELKGYSVHKVLDLACGSGWLSFMLAENGFSVTGVDVSPSAIKLAKRVHAEIFDNSLDVNFICHDILDMQLDTADYDCVLINACLEHFNLNRVELLIDNLKKHLKPDGLIYGVFDLVAVSDKGEFVNFDDGTRQYLDPMREGMYLRNYTDEEISRLFSASGFQQISYKAVDNGSRVVVFRGV